MAENLTIARKQLDARFRKMKAAALHVRPTRGWIRAIRNAIGMTSAQLAAQLGVSQPRITALEQAEVNGSATMQSLAAAAEALNCTLVYALVPNQPLETMVQKRVEKLANVLLKAVSHTMSLEDQAISPADIKNQRRLLIEDILRHKTSRLWDER